MIKFDLNNKRSKFANEVSKLLVKANDNNIHNALENIKPIYDMFFENIRNFYECDVPLFTLYELKKTDNLDDWCESELELPKNQVIEKVFKICQENYL